MPHVDGAALGHVLEVASLSLKNMNVLNVFDKSDKLISFIIHVKV